MTDAVVALLADPRSALLAIDFDGTLAAIVERPEDARLVDGAHDVLSTLAAHLGGVAVISGRGAEEVIDLGDLDQIERLHVLGHYGLQRWHAGRLESPPPAPGIGPARERLADLLADADPGVFVENKGHSVAVHTRRAADPGASLDELTPRLLDLAASCGLEAVPGRYVLELRPAGIDKGAALHHLIDALGSRVVVYVGDDLGDLPAYDVIERLREHGDIEGLTVASADPADSDAPTALAERADVVLAGPTAVVAWLAGIAAMLD